MFLDHLARPLPVPLPIDKLNYPDIVYPDTILITTTAQQGYSLYLFLSSRSQYMVNADALYFSFNGAVKKVSYSMTDSFGCSIF